MTLAHREHSLDYWNDAHQKQNFSRESIKVDNWLERFADIVMKTQRPILDLGCGGGNDTLYLIGKGKQVIPCDQSEYAIENVKRNFPEIKEAHCLICLISYT